MHHLVQLPVSLRLCYIIYLLYYKSLLFYFRYQRFFESLLSFAVYAILKKINSPLPYILHTINVPI